MATALTQDQLNAIAKQSGYSGTFSNVGLAPATSAQSPTIQPGTNPNANYFSQTTQSLTPAVNTSQPSPSTVNATPYTGNSIVDALSQSGQASDFASRSKLAQQYGIQGYTGTADQNTQLLQKYKGGFQQAQQSGVEAPKTQGLGSSMVNSFTGGPSQMPSVNPLDTIMSQDKGYQDLLKLYGDYTSSQNQQKSLTDTYSQMIKDSGVEGLDAQLVNSKKIIDGTEQDIRNEISAVGGFGTESQVQALAGARNKTLIQNYNQLLATRDNALNRINTMIGLSQQDRQYAQSQFENQLNFQTQINQYRDKFVNNAKEAYNAVIQAQGYGGLYNALKGSPTDLALAEKTLGLGQGQLAQMATYQKPLTQEEQLRNKNLELQNKKLTKELSGGSGGSKVLSISDAKALGVPYGTTEAQAIAMGITPGVDEARDKAIAKAQATPEYKTISGVLPAIQSLKAYKDAINTYGTTEKVNGEGKGTLAGTYGNALATWKSLAGLGALSGADFTLAENAVPETGFFNRKSTMIGKIDASLTNAVSQAEALTKRLISANPEAAPVINVQLIDALKAAYPEKNYTLSPDGMEVIEL
jgi:hypothetical protein